MRPGDAGNTEDLSGRVMDAVELVEEMYGQEHEEGVFCIKDLTGDKGYHRPAELGIIQEAAGLRTILGDPNAGRRQPANLKPEVRRAVAKAARAADSKSGKALFKKRGEQLQRDSLTSPTAAACGAPPCAAGSITINAISAESPRST